MRITRRRIALAAVAGLTTGGAVAALLGWYGFALAAAIALIGGALVLAIDLRGRSASIAAKQSQLIKRTKALASPPQKPGYAGEELLLSLVGPDGVVGRMERRLLLAVEGAAGLREDRHADLVAAIERAHAAVEAASDSLVGLSSAVDRLDARPPGVLGADVDAAVTAVLRAMRSVTREEAANLEAMLQVLPAVRPRALLPSTGGFAISARALAHLVDLVTENRPRTVLELGSGTSTVWLGYLLAEWGGRLISLDHDDYFGHRTQLELARHSLDGVGEVRIAPLTGDGGEVPWYETGCLDDVTDVDLLFVSGPPASVAPSVRAPALPRLLPRLAPGALVLLDDADRPDEATIVEDWLTTVPGLVRRDIGVSPLAVLQLT